MEKRWTFSCNQHSICANCNRKGEFVKCPICMKESRDKWFVNDSMVKQIADSLTVKCLSKECGWTGRRDTVENHVKTCSFFYYCECGMTVEYDAKTEHLLTCPNIDVKCEYCHKSYKANVIQEHVEKCKTEVIPCVRGCDYKISVDNVEVEKRAVLTCGWKGPRNKYGQHLYVCRRILSLRYNANSIDPLTIEIEKLKTELELYKAMYPQPQQPSPEDTEVEQLASIEETDIRC